MVLEIQPYRTNTNTDVSQVPVSAVGNSISYPLVFHLSVSLASKRTSKFENNEHGLLPIRHRQFDKISITTL
jgi:hypothetical protein